MPHSVTTYCHDLATLLGIGIQQREKQNNLGKGLHLFKLICCWWNRTKLRAMVNKVMGKKRHFIKTFFSQKIPLMQYYMYGRKNYTDILLHF